MTYCRKPLISISSNLSRAWESERSNIQRGWASVYFRT